MSLHGTRDAAMNWQEEVARELRKIGFRRGKCNPCLYYHAERNLKTFLHGDDFATVGTRKGTACLKEALEKRFEIKSQCVGPAALEIGGKAVVSTSNGLTEAGAGACEGPAATATNGEKMIEGTEGRLLNRIVRCTSEGWEVEPDQRHADLIVKELALNGANGVTTPGRTITNPKKARWMRSCHPQTQLGIELFQLVPVT